MNESTEENLSQIKELIAEAEGYNGQQRSPSINMRMYEIMSRVKTLSDGEVDFSFEGKNNTNSRLGAYKITVIAPDDVEEALSGSSNEVEGT